MTSDYMPSGIPEIDDFSIPVMIDDVRHCEGFGFVRCDYFTIECKSPSPGWTLRIKGNPIPFLMTGLSGIVFQPSYNTTNFTNPSQIEELFHQIESTENFFIGTADVWLPESLVMDAIPSSIGSVRGATVRVHVDFFNAALAFRNDSIGKELFLQKAEQARSLISFSNEENRAFAAWQKLQIEMAIEQYPKDANLALSWSDGPESHNGGGETSNE